MATISLEYFKKWVRADDIDADDEVLQQCLDSAEAQVVEATNRTKEELLEKGGGESLPLALQVAVLSLAASWYRDPEAMSSVQMHVSPQFTAAIKRYRRLSSREGGDP